MGYKQIARLGNISEYVVIIFKMQSLPALQLWKSQIPLYQRIIARSSKSLFTPLTRFLPSHFDQKVSDFKELLRYRELENYEDYLDVIVQKIEGVKNKSSIQLADMLVQQYGATIPFWQNIILDVAENVDYAGQFSLWHLRKVFDEKLYVDAENLSNYRRFCKISKSYIVALKNLIKYVQKFDKKKDTINRIDELFKKVKDAESKYIHFTQNTQVCEHSMTMDDVSNNVSQRSRQNAVKNLFNFGDKKPANDKSKNTLFNYNFKMSSQSGPERASEPTKNMKITNLSIKGDRLRKFQKCLQNISKHQSDISDLKAQFCKSQRKNRTDKQKYYTIICDPDQYFSYNNFQMDYQQDINFKQPYEQYSFLNYQIDEEQLLNELVGEDIDIDTSFSSCSQLSNPSFIVSQGHLSEDQDNDITKKKPSFEMKFGDKWNFQPLNQYSLPKQFCKNDYSMLFFGSNKDMPLPLIERQFEQYEVKLMAIVDGCDRKSIMQKLSKDKIKITKKKIDSFLKKFCDLQSLNDKNAVYRLKRQSQYQSDQLSSIKETQQEKQNNSRKSKNQTTRRSQKSQQKMKQRQFYSEGGAKKYKIQQDSCATQGQEEENMRRSKRIRHRKSQNQSQK